MIRPQDRSKDPDRIDDRQFQRSALAANEIPGRTFRQRFRLHIGAYLGCQVGPVLFRERTARNWPLAIADGGKGRGEHHLFDARIARGPQHAQRTLARRNDQIVLVFRHARRERRSDMKNVLASRDRFQPAGVCHQIGVGEGKRIARLGTADPQHGENIGFALGGSHCCADAVACLQQG